MADPTRPPTPRPHLRLAQVDEADPPIVVARRASNALLAITPRINELSDDVGGLQAAVIAHGVLIKQLPEQVVAALRVTLRNDVHLAVAAEREKLRDELLAQVHREVQGSMHDSDKLRQAAREGAAMGAAEATGPHPIADPDVITPNRLEARLLKERLADIEAERARLAAERDKASDLARQAAREKRDRLWSIAAPVIVGVLGFLGMIVLAYFLGTRATHPQIAPLGPPPMTR